MAKCTSQNNLSVLMPELAQEWHASKNGKLTPEKTTPMSHKRVWWLCKKGHEWESIVSNRTQHNRGCPYCVNQKAYAGNCLATINPRVAKEWHPTKNGKLTPEDVTPGSSRKKVWWRCDKGHDWQALVKNRSNGHGCPCCSGLKVCKENSLAFKIPNLVREWHSSKNGSLTPNDVTSASGRKVWWICKKGHEYVASMGSRSRGTGCPLCTNKTSVMELRVFTELKYVFPDIRHRERIDKVECDVYFPSLMVGLEYDGVYWHKDKNEKDRLKNIFLEKKGVKLIRVRESGLTTISENDVIFDLRKKKYKQLVDELLKKIQKISVLSKSDQENIDSYLAKTELANNDLFINMLDMLPLPFPGSSVLDQKPGLAKEWHPIKNGKLAPGDVTPFSNKKIWWKCSRGHEWEAIIGDRTNGTNCPYCGNKKACKDNCLATINPALAEEWHPTKNGKLTPEDVTPYSNKRIWWQCQNRHEWEAGANNRSAGHGCPYCAGQRVTKETSLAVKKPHLAAEWHPAKNGKLTPRDVMPGTHKKVWWQCREGHSWEASVSNRSKSGCPFCGNKKVCEDNCLARKNSQLAKEWNSIKNGNLTPRDIVPGSHKKVWWKCNKGHEWEAKVVDRSNGNGCRLCRRKRATSENHQLRLNLE